jgi:hypothetical protein
MEKPSQIVADLPRIVAGSRLFPSPRSAGLRGEAFALRHVTRRSSPRETPMKQAACQTTVTDNQVATEKSCVT